MLKWICSGETCQVSTVKNKKAAAHAPQPNNHKGTERDLGLVDRRTPRRQFANCDGIDKVEVEHQECAPFVGIYFRTEFTPAGGFVSRNVNFTDFCIDLTKRYFLFQPVDAEMGGAFLGSPEQDIKGTVKARLNGLDHTSPTISRI